MLSAILDFILNNDNEHDFSAREELFFESRDGNDPEYIKELIIESRKENILDTLKLLFRLRKLSNNTKYLFYDLFIELFNFDDEVREALIYNIENIVKFGRWDDLIELYNRLYHDEDFCNSVLFLISQQLISDIEVINPSLVAKWIPSEGSRLDKPRHFYSHLANYMRLTKGQLRKNYISPLRSKLNIVERNICEGNYSKIDYMSLGEKAITKHEHIFLKYDRNRYLKYKKSVNLSLEDEIVNIYYKSFSTFKNSSDVFVLDLNMYPSVLKYAIAMILNQSFFITFEEEPKIIYFPISSSVRERIRMILNLISSDFTISNESGIRFEKIYSLVCGRGVDRVLILTNSLKYGYNLNTIEKKFSLASENIPHCVYWCMKPNTPLHFFDYEDEQWETVLMGYDVESLPYMFSSDIMTLSNVMYKVLDSKTYNSIKLLDES